jgi:hypothetical protein
MYQAFRKMVSYHFTLWMRHLDPPNPPSFLRGAKRSRVYQAFSKMVSPIGNVGGKTLVPLLPLRGEGVRG